MTTSLLLESRKVCINKTRCSCHNRQAASAEKLQLKAAKILTPIGIARSKQDTVTCGHGAQYIYPYSPPPPAPPPPAEGQSRILLYKEAIVALRSVVKKKFVTLPA